MDYILILIVNFIHEFPNVFIKYTDENFTNSFFIIDNFNLPTNFKYYRKILVFG